mmetsp:Transcript_33187/g.88855  ORF Transcript_33187/g.88855 Transcript_33187/m.88855 type:complete len:335 (-) Transcript_33187:421-1425(-)
MPPRGRGVQAGAQQPQFLYVLRLQHGKWYVGTTTSPNIRFQQHMNGSGSEWTAQHPPVGNNFHNISQLHCSSQEARFKEDAEVKMMMSRHGMDAVRGGTYSRAVLSNSDTEALQKELRHGQGDCLRCGRNNHWSSNCFAKTSVSGDPIIDEDPQPARSGPPVHNNGRGADWTAQHPPVGNQFHEILPIDCSSRDSRFKVDAEVKMMMSQYGMGAVRGGTNVQALLSNSGMEALQEELRHGQGDCWRCGRKNHRGSDCFARTSVSGDLIIDDHQPAGSRPPVRATSVTQMSQHSVGKRARRETDECHRCGRAGHWGSECFARTDVYGTPLSDSES